MGESGGSSFLLSDVAGVGREKELSAGAQSVIPVVGRGSESLDGWVERDHGLRHTLAGRVGVEAAVDGTAVLDQSG